MNGGFTLTMNLISGTYHSHERKKYALIILRKYTIISQWMKQIYNYGLYYILFQIHAKYLLELVAILISLGHLHEGSCTVLITISGTFIHCWYITENPHHAKFRK